MHLFKSSKAQYITEHIILTSLIVMSLSLIRLHLSDVEIILFSHDLNLLTPTSVILVVMVLFMLTLSFLRKKGRWFKYKDFLPKAIKVLFVIFMNIAIFGSIRGSLRIPLNFSLIIPVIFILISAIVNYYFNIAKANARN